MPHTPQDAFSPDYESHLRALTAEQLWAIATDDVIGAVRLDQALVAIVELRDHDALIALRSLRHRMLEVLAWQASDAMGDDIDAPRGAHLRVVR